jgi:hypothetical protein
MSAGDILNAALSRTDLSPKARAFLLDIDLQRGRAPISARQIQAVERIASAPPRPDFAAIRYSSGQGRGCRRRALGRLITASDRR